MWDATMPSLRKPSFLDCLSADSSMGNVVLFQMTHQKRTSGRVSLSCHFLPLISLDESALLDFKAPVYFVRLITELFAGFVTCHSMVANLGIFPARQGFFLSQTQDSHSLDFFTSLPLKKAWSSVGADRGSGLTRPLVARTPPPPMLVTPHCWSSHKLRCYPPPWETSPPLTLSPPTDFVTLPH